jgi:group I intron endonuclease
MKIYTIYKATNIVNGKVYVGFDSNWPQRKYTHRYRCKERACVFHKAMMKYGKDNFSWEILYQSQDYNHTLSEMEPHFIREHKSNIKQFGYNMTSGGEGGPDYKHTPEHIESITGKSNRLYDHTVYTFVHPTYGEFKGNALELIAQYPKIKIDRSQLTRVIKGKIISVKGWKLIGISDTALSERKRQRAVGSKNPMYDPTVYTFEHLNDGQFVGTRYEWITKYGLPKNCRLSILKYKISYGWKIIRNNQ